MSDISSTIAFSNFRKQLDSLSESLHQFDPVDRSKALEILQEYIQGLENKHAYLMTEVIPEEVMITVDELEDKQNENAFCTLNEEDLCLNENLVVVEMDDCSDCTVPEEVLMNSVDALIEENQNEGDFCTLNEDLCLEKNLPEVENDVFSDCSVPEELMTTVDEMTQGKQNEVYCPIHEDITQDDDLDAVEADNCNLYEEMQSLISDTNQIKNGKYLSTKGKCQTKMTAEELPEFVFPSEEELEEEEWTVLKCPKCEQECNSKQSFMDHLQLQHTGKVKTCRHCHKVYNNSMAFKSHRQLALCLKSKKKLKCKLCNKVLFGGSQYNTHISAHKRNQCKVCGDHFATKKQLDAHTLNMHNSSSDKNAFKCNICERGFVQRRSLVYHFNLVHSQTCLICSVCLEVFESHSLLETHLRTHKQQIITCEKCPLQFSRRQQYLLHLKDHERYKCLTCSEAFSSKKAAIRHARLGHHMTGLEPQLQCAECGQMFLSRVLLKNHMNLHAGGLACEKCKITFKHERYYRSHLETKEHLRGEDIKNYFACKECNKMFINKNNLRIHVSRMHKTGLKEHACNFCSYKTTVPNNLKRHIALHTERPQFICDKCGSQFQTKSSLQEHHQQLHSDTKDFSCDKCGKMFVRASDLNRHLSNTHSDKPQHTCHCGNNYKTLSNLKRHQLVTHGKVDTKLQRLKKLFPLDNNSEPPKKKVKKRKLKKEKSLKSTDDLQLINSQVSPIAETDTVVMMADSNPPQLLEVAYNMDFTEDNKSHVVYAENLDMGALEAVESMIEMDRDPTKQDTSVLINVRNLFTTDYMMEQSMVSSLEDSLAEATQHITVSSQKGDVIASLHDYDIPHDLSFLNV